MVAMATLERWVAVHGERGAPVLHHQCSNEVNLATARQAPTPKLRRMASPASSCQERLLGIGRDRDEVLKADSMNFAAAGDEVNLVETLSAGRPSENLSCEKCKMVCGLVSPSQAFLTTHRFALFLLGFTFVDATCMCAFHSTKSKECNRHAECARSVPPCRPAAPTACAQ